MDVTPEEVTEAVRRGLLSGTGMYEMTIAVLRLRCLLVEEELAYERHQHQTTTELLQGQQAMVRQLQEAIRDPKHFDALPLEAVSNGA